MNFKNFKLGFFLILMGGFCFPGSATEKVKAAELKAKTAAQIILESYLKVQSQLALDNLSAAQNELKSLEKTIKQSSLASAQEWKACSSLVLAVMRAKNIEESRQNFAKWSDWQIASLKNQPKLLDGQTFQVSCPMALNNRGASWLQVGKSIRNPYYGAAMLKCGEIVGVKHH